MVKNTPGPEPHRAIYGFCFNLFFTSLFWLYVLWVLPYQALGYMKHFYFVPDTYFAFSLPVFVLCGIVLFLFLYSSVNMAKSADVESTTASKDSTVHCKCQEEDVTDFRVSEDQLFTNVDNLSKTSAFAMDIDLSHVSRALYSKTLYE